MGNLQIDKNNILLNIGHSLDELSVDEAISTYRDTMDGYTYPINDVNFKNKEFKSFIDEVYKEYPDTKEYQYGTSKNSIFTKYVSEHFRMYVRGNSIDLFGTVITKTEDVCHKFWSLYTKYVEQDDDVQMFVHYYSMVGPQIDETVKLMNRKEIDYISEKFYPYIDTQIMFDQFFTDNENILLLVGAPGLGKSKMSTLALKHALNNPDKLPYDKMAMNPALDSQYVSVAICKSTDILSNDQFWKTLEKNTPDFCIIDDLDYMLTKRDSEVMSGEDQHKNKFLNHFLSYTDGVEKHKTKFIITTNQSYADIDSALLRKGRLFDILELRHLTSSESLAIWEDNGLNAEQFNIVFGGNESILPADLGSEINKRLNKRIKTATQSYCKEEGISKVQKAGRAKKIGL